MGDNFDEKKISVLEILSKNNSGLRIGNFERCGLVDPFFDLVREGYIKEEIVNETIYNLAGGTFPIPRREYFLSEKGIAKYFELINSNKKE